MAQRKKQNGSRKKNVQEKRWILSRLGWFWTYPCGYKCGYCNAGSCDLPVNHGPETFGGSYESPPGHWCNNPRCDNYQDFHRKRYLKVWRKPLFSPESSS